MIANYYGRDTDLRAIRARFGSSQRGAGLRTLIALFDRLGCSARAVGLELKDLNKLHVPAMLHWDLRHFVVLERVKAGKALIHDPNGRSIWMRLDEVSQHFTGVALEVRSAGAIQEHTPSRRLRLRQLWQNLTGLRRALIQTVVLSLILQIFTLTAPYYMQVAIDTALPALDFDLLTTLAIGFGLFTIINAVAGLLRGFVLLSAGTSVGFGIATNIARRLLRLPVTWFESRATGDILSRFQSVLPIQRMLTEGAVGTIVDGALAITTLLLMLFYSPILALLAVIALALVLASRLVSFSLERDATELSIVASGKEQTMLIESLRGITTLRLFAQEIVRHGLWQAKRVDAINAEVRRARIGIWQGVANVTIFGIESVLCIWIGIRLIMHGEGFSVGMFFAYVAYKTQFIARAESLVEQCISLKMLGLHLERLADIALTEEDKSFGSNEEIRNDLSGAIAACELQYRYSTSDPLVLSGVNLTVKAGEHIAITGASGSGKSTLIKILLGLIEPTEGKVLIDGMPIENFGYRSYHQQVSGILQEDSLFSGSLAENIALFADDLDMSRVIEAAKLAAIHDDILKMPMQYESLVGDMGSTLSGGQKQRVILARALYRKPRLLIMDEGTAHLDAINEEVVSRGIRNLGITRIVVAHRQETVQAADRAYLLIGGKLEELDRHKPNVAVDREIS